MPRAERSLHRHVEAVGLSPGSITVPEGAHPPKIAVTLFDRDRYETQRGVDVEALRQVPSDGRYAWVDVVGLGDKAVLEKLIEIFGIPWLAMEDVLHSPQRPKVDVYDDARFIIARMFDRRGTCDTDQFSIFVRDRVLLTFQERPGDPFDQIRHRLAQKEAQIRQRGIDYLLYRLVDACVDSSFPEVARLSEQVEAIEEAAIERPTARLIRRLHLVRHDLRILERVALATRDAMGTLAHDEEGFFEPSTLPYLRDVLDHATQVVELTHYYSSVASDIGQFIIGALDMRMNLAMRTLAGVTVVLMPLTVITGIYGMNFEHMPELKSTWGYYAVLAVMAATAVVLTLWLRRSGWLRGDAD